MGGGTVLVGATKAARASRALKGMTKTYNKLNKGMVPCASTPLGTILFILRGVKYDMERETTEFLNQNKNL